MARTKSRKTEDSKSAIPATEEVSAAAGATATSPQCLPSDAWESTTAYHLLTHGCFPRPPRHYAELFYPLAEYYVHHGAQRNALARPTSTSAENGDAHAAQEQSKPSAAASRRHGGYTASAEEDNSSEEVTGAAHRASEQIEVLKELVFPHGTHGFFCEMPLLAVTDPQPVLATTTDPASAEATTPDKAAQSRKRRRAGSPDVPPRDAACASTDTEQSEVERLITLLIDSGRTYLSSFTGDNEYLAAKEVFFVVRHWGTTGSSMAFTPAFMSVVHRMRISVPTMVRPCVMALPRILAAHIQARLESMTRPPRVIRVGRALQLTAKEVHALTYALLCHCGALLPLSSAGSLAPSSIAFHAGLSPQELTYFVMESRPHVKQGLLASDIKYRTTFMECKYAMPQEAVAALSGNQLSDEQIIKLERTALAEVLAAEKREDDNGSGSSGAGRKRGAVLDSPTLTAMQAALDTGDVGGAITNVMDVMAQLKGKLDQLPESSSYEHSPAESGTDQSREESADREDSVDDHHTPSLTALPTQQALEDVLESVAGRSGAAASGQQQQQQASATDGATTATPHEANTGTDTKEPAVVERGVGLDMELKDIDPFRPRSSRPDGSGSGGDGDDTGGNNSDKMHLPYTSNIEYMDESFKVLANLIKIRTAEGDMKDEDEGFLPKNKVEATLRELKGKVRVSSAIHHSRVQATLKAIEAAGEGTTVAFVPRIEQLSRRLALTELEKQIMLLMIGNVVSHDILVAINGRYVMRDGQRLLTVGYILFVLCEGLPERVTARKAFYQSSSLLSNGVITLSLDGGFQRTRFNTDLMDYYCDIDRKIIDYLMGIETETSEMVPGSRLYHPQVPVSNVVLPRQTTDLVLSTIEHYGLFEACRRSCGFGEGLGISSTGLVMLFYGPSGTGKTMLANAVAHELKKRILLVNVSQFKSDGKAPEMMRFVFREAKLNDAIIFFDECESLFETRESNPLVTAVLAEFEKYDGLIVMATNKAQNMDEAMNRRISLMVEFKLPDHQLRERIWDSHIPKQLRCNADVSVEKLALNFELSGGLIRNAVLAALSHAVAREKNSVPELCQDDFEVGARLQLRGFFLAAQRPQGSSEYYITPRRTMADLVVEKDLQHKLEAVANLLKSRNTLFSQWGFSEDNWEHQSSMYLFHGADGTGKSLAAEGIAYECGATIRLCNLSEVFLAREINVVQVFEEARKLGAIVVFDEAQVLFNHTEQSMQVSQLIQYHAARYPRPVLLLATSGGSDGHGGGSGSLDIAAAKLKFEQELFFPLPNRALREQLWKQVFPDKVPLEEDVDFAKLSALPASAKLIRAVAFSACCKVALLPVSQRRLSMKMIEDELSEQRLRDQRRKPVSGMFA